MRCREERSAPRQLPTVSPPKRERASYQGEGDEAVVLEASRRPVPSTNVELRAESFASEKRHQPVIDDRMVRIFFDDVDALIVAVSVRL
jgi:hypothetical protein